MRADGFARTIRAPAHTLRGVVLADCVARERVPRRGIKLHDPHTDRQNTVERSRVNGERGEGLANAVHDMCRWRLLGEQHDELFSAVSVD
jgi:hypothetical protein